MKVKLFIFSIIILIFVALIAWFLWDVYRSDRIQNILLISIDTCRADYLSCYGYPGNTTPNIDAIAQKGVLFENAVTPVPITLPAHCSMLTGTFPPYHGVHDNAGFILDDASLTLAEILKDKGLTTAAVVGSFVLNAKFGLDQGFDFYDDTFESSEKTIGISERRAGEVTKHAISWLKKHKSDPFFLFLHYFDPHLVYEPPEPFKSTFADDLYAGEIAYVDYSIGKIIDRLKSLDLYDSTLIIVTGDHGEGLGEHDESTHGFFIYQSTLKVPLIFKVPGGHKGVKISAPVGLVDIVPTVYNLFKMPLNSQVQGKDLSPYFTEKDYSLGKRYFYCEALLPTLYNCNPLLGVITERFKYIQTTRPELYDLSNDPKELVDVIKQHPQKTRILADEIKKILEQVHAEQNKSKATLDSKTRTRLESLGYVSGRVVDDSFEFDKTFKDPKDLIEFHELNAQAKTHLVRNEYSLSKQMCDKMLQIDPNFPETYRYLGSISFKNKNDQKAIYFFSEYLKRDPDSYGTYNNLALALSRSGNVEEAIKSFRKAIELKPDFTEAHHNLGIRLFRKGRLELAIKHFRKAQKLAPDDKEVNRYLDAVLREHKKITEAIDYFKHVLTAYPKEFKAHNDLSQLYAGQGKYDLAIKHMNRSLEIDPNQLEVYNNLASAYYNQKNFAKTHEYLTGSLRLKPDQPDVYRKLGVLSYDRKNFAEAMEYFAESIRLRPNQTSILNRLAELHFARGNIEQTIKYFTDSITFRPNQPEILNSLAWIKATNSQQQLRDPVKALEYAQKACELSKFNVSGNLDTLAAALAANERFTEAVQTAQKAMTLLDTHKEEDRLLAEEIKARLKLYKADKPYFQTSGE